MTATAISNTDFCAPSQVQCHSLFRMHGWPAARRRRLVLRAMLALRSVVVRAARRVPLHAAACRTSYRALPGWVGCRGQRACCRCGCSGASHTALGLPPSPAVPPGLSGLLPHAALRQQAIPLASVAQPLALALTPLPILVTRRRQSAAAAGALGSHLSSPVHSTAEHAAAASLGAWLASQRQWHQTGSALTCPVHRRAWRRRRPGRLPGPPARKPSPPAALSLPAQTRTLRPVAGAGVRLTCLAHRALHGAVSFMDPMRGLPQVA